MIGFKDVQSYRDLQDVNILFLQGCPITLIKPKSLIVTNFSSSGIVSSSIGP
jgi:hypothetical protein